MKTYVNLLTSRKAKEESTPDYLQSSLKKFNKIIREYIQNIEGMKKGTQKCIERLRRTEKELIICKINIQIYADKINEAFTADKVDLYVKYVKYKENLEENLTTLEKRYSIEKNAVEKLQNNRFRLLKKAIEVMHAKNKLEAKFNISSTSSDVKKFIANLQASESSSNSNRKLYKLVKDIAFE